MRLLLSSPWLLLLTANCAPTEREYASGNEMLGGASTVVSTHPLIAASTPDDLASSNPSGAPEPTLFTPPTEVAAPITSDAVLSATVASSSAEASGLPSAAPTVSSSTAPPAVTACGGAECVPDCVGVVGGSAQLDNCGTCDADPSNDCANDCLGVAGGDALRDNCGTCDANANNDCTQDCAGTWGGEAYEDGCGTCDANPNNDCTADCAGVLGGNAREDNCGTCDSSPANDCDQDCAGTWGGNAQRDNCGTCDTNSNNNCTQDCAGTWGGTAQQDNCGVCDANANNNCTQDCNGVWGGSSRTDACGICDANAGNDCTQDCNGVWGGPAIADACGVCDSNSANDCFDGDSGTIVVAQDTTFDVGTGNIYWTVSGTQTAWIYSGYGVTYANFKSVSSCPQVGGSGSGYTGLTALSQLTNAASYTYTDVTDRAILFGTQQSTCYMGLLVFQQNGRYGVLEFERMTDGGQAGVLDDLLTINYWVGNTGVTNFSNAN
jgi:hypothetical protein